MHCISSHLWFLIIIIVTNILHISVHAQRSRGWECAANAADKKE
ncbi:hypothetical protein CLOHYLEM_07189 [[Clostridium] hylemonae DSM 15053]|uniref:Uncharacterized protein n=1 Tax=[Clostridium] hylemonae DSM 15053 TaxID=553973 RepID=C0C520_9FIRM|nr:hypothetical protein CLOHYLEM_07189 [[Clostridium] hylemonae DSM 15053]